MRTTLLWNKYICHFLNLHHKVIHRKYEEIKRRVFDLPGFSMNPKEIQLQCDKYGWRECKFVVGLYYVSISACLWCKERQALHLSWNSFISVCVCVWMSRWVAMSGWVVVERVSEWLGWLSDYVRYWVGKWITGWVD
jgi:hypothetical protein